MAKIWTETKANSGTWLATRISPLKRSRNYTLKVFIIYPDSLSTTFVPSTQISLKTKNKIHSYKGRK